MRSRAAVFALFGTIIVLSVAILFFSSFTEKERRVESGGTVLRKKERVSASFQHQLTLGLTAKLAASSPSGAGIPGFFEVLRFTLVAVGDKDIEVKELNFRPTTTCQKFHLPTDGYPTAFLYETADPSTPLKIWAWKDVSEFLNGFSATDVKKTIVAGTAKVFGVKFDTTGCSSMNDEAFRLDLVSGKGKTGGASPTVLNIQNTPVIGGTIIY